MTTTAHAFIRMSLVAAASAALIGCAGATAPARQAHTTVRVDPAPGSAPVVAQGAADPGALPALPQASSNAGGPALSAAPERRISAIDVKPGTSIATAVSEIGSRFGLTVSVDPAVQGTVQASLRNVTLNEALQQIVTHNGAQYQLQGSVLRVIPIRMESRTFTLDYVALSRVGAMSTVVQRRLSSTTGGISAGTTGGLSSAAAGIAAAGGGDVLTAQSVADIWLDIRVALSGIMSAGLVQRTGTAGNETTTSAPPPQSATGSVTNGPSATSTTFADGSVLIVSPISGLINVTAMPDRIAAVEKFINEFQASVLRQVMIQAKIVEVQLDHRSEFGIDWAVVSNSASNKFGITLRSDPNVITTGNTGNVNFTFTGGTTTISAIVRALESQGDVNVLSNEQTSALNNQRAIFQVTTDQVFFSVNRLPLLGPNGGVATIQSSINAQQVSVGVVLDVLPQISADNILTMDIRPAITTILDTTSITLSDGTSASAPNIARREGDTIARMRAGETMMIGGLVQTRRERTVSGIPVLMDIPLIGKAFQHINNHEVRSELVVFLTPTIISGQPAPGR